MSDTVLFGKIKDPELVVFIFRGQLQCRMGGGGFELVKKELEMTPEKFCPPSSPSSRQSGE